MTEQNKKTTSKFISLVLRHKPQAANLTLDEKGWVEVDKLLAALNREGRIPVTLADLKEIVHSSDKNRFSFNDDGTKIRANQGHSVKVDVELKETDPPDILYHGTAERFISSIKASGLKAQTRLHVHLSADETTAVGVGCRHGKPVVLTVDTAKMRADGFKFYLSENGVWLTERVPVEYLTWENNAVKNKRKIIAQETLKIQEKGYYILPNNKHIDISAAQKHSENASRLITPEQGKLLIKDLTPSDGIENTLYEIVNASTVKAIIDSGKTGGSVAALNFASAKNPGGGFINGAMAQEEALAASSGLYNTQLRHIEYYKANRDCHSMMYTDHAIYSPDVVFFRDADYNLLEEPVTASILTLPAVNMGQVKVQGEDVTYAQTVMKNRMRLALAIFAKENNKTIILGAYGCGVFGNDPNDVAKWWKELLFNERYGGYFKQVLFVILDKPGGVNIIAFERLFGNFAV